MITSIAELHFWNNSWRFIAKSISSFHAFISHSTTFTNPGQSYGFHPSPFLSGDHSSNHSTVLLLDLPINHLKPIAYLLPSLLPSACHPWQSLNSALVRYIHWSGLFSDLYEFGFVPLTHFLVVWLCIILRVLLDFVFIKLSCCQLKSSDNGVADSLEHLPLLFVPTISFWMLPFCQCFPTLLWFSYMDHMLVHPHFSLLLIHSLSIGSST